MDTQYRKNISHQSKWLLWSELPDEVITLMKITLKSKAGLVLINYSHDILDQEVQNNGGCPEAAGSDKQRFLQPRKYQNYPRPSWFGNWLWALIVKIQGCCFINSSTLKTSSISTNSWGPELFKTLQETSYILLGVQINFHSWFIWYFWMDHPYDNIINIKVHIYQICLMPENIVGLIAQNLSKKGFWLAAHNRGAPEFNTLEQRLYK